MDSHIPGTLCSSAKSLAGNKNPWEKSWLMSHDRLPLAGCHPCLTDRWLLAGPHPGSKLAARRAWLRVPLPGRLQKSMLHFGDTAMSLLEKHSSVSKIKALKIFLLPLRILNIIFGFFFFFFFCLDYTQNTPNVSILVFGLPSRTHIGDV